MNIVDYSLLAVIDTKRKKIRFAILDYCQFFNSRKLIEFHVKHTVYLGGLPTIVPPEVYRVRFMNFMTRHFVGVCTQLTKKKKNQKTSKEMARRSLAVQAEDLDNMVSRQRKLEGEIHREIQAVMREVNQGLDNEERQVVSDINFPGPTNMITTDSLGVKQTNSTKNL